MSITVTPDSTRGDLLVCLGHLNDQAKRELRVDNLGRENKRWAKLHDDMEPIVLALLKAGG